MFVTIAEAFNVITNKIVGHTKVTIFKPILRPLGLFSSRAYLNKIFAFSALKNSWIMACSQEREMIISCSTLYKSMCREDFSEK
jgi:hypothetical protein